MTRRSIPVRLEKFEQQDGVKLLRSLGAVVYTIGTVRPRGDHPGTAMSPGLPDVICFLPRRGTAGRTLVVWEVKAPGGRLRPEQREFASLCFDAGVSHCTGDLTALMVWLVGHGFLKVDQLPHTRRPADGKIAERSSADNT